MATWIDPVDSQTDPDAPITSDLAKRWDNNVIALAEGAPGAPPVDVAAISGIYIDGFSSASNKVVTGLGNIRYLRMLILTNSTLNMQFSSDNGVTFGPSRIISNITDETFEVNIDIVSGRAIVTSFGGFNITNVTVPTGVNAIRFPTPGSVSISGAIYAVQGVK